MRGNTSFWFWDLTSWTPTLYLSCRLFSDDHVFCYKEFSASSFTDFTPASRMQLCALPAFASAILLQLFFYRSIKSLCMQPLTHEIPPPKERHFSLPLKERLSFSSIREPRESKVASACDRHYADLSLIQKDGKSTGKNTIAVTAIIDD